MFRSLAKYFRRRTRALSRFCAAEHGTTTVEFALIAAPFFAMLFAVIQTTLFLFAQQTLQNAAVEAGRMFMTGSAQTSGLTQTQFESAVCPMVSALFTCSKLLINVSSYQSVSSANASEPSLYNANGSLILTGTYSPGAQGDIMVVELAYPWPIVGMPLGSVLANTGYGTTEMMGVTAFRVEPY